MENLTVTESMANGLKNRFFDEMIRGSDLVEKIFSNEKSKIKTNRASFSNVSTSMRKLLAEHAVVMYEGGTDRKPYITLDLMTILKDRSFNSWNEKCLTGRTLLMNMEPYYYQEVQAPYNIGEHAISRLYLRTKPKIENNSIDYKYIKKELEQIPLWASFWGITLFNQTGNEYFDKAYPVIPTESGLLLCEFSRQSQRVEIRTFVSEAYLTHEQKIARDLLMEAGVGLIESPLSMFPILVKTQIDFPFILHAIISRRLFQDHRYSSLMNVIFHRVEDDGNRVKYKSEVDKIIKSHASCTNDSMEQLLNKEGLKKYMAEMKRAYIKSAIKS